MGSWSESLKLFGGLFVLLVLGYTVISFGMGLLFRRLDPVRVRRWLGGENRLIGVVKGVLIGIITPFCSSIGVPFVISLIRAGAPFATVMGFLFASPLLNPFIPFIIGALFGWKVVLGYAAVVLVLSVVMAWLADALGMERYLETSVVEQREQAQRQQPVLVGGGGPPVAEAQADTSPVPCGTDDERCGSSPEGNPPWRGLRAEAKPAWDQALCGFRGVLLRLTVAIGIAAVLHATVPDGALAGFMSTVGFLAVPIAALVAIPLYIREEAALPIAYALVQSGVGIGPVFAMIIAASGASLPEMAMLSTVFQRRLLATFIASVFVIAMASGWLIPLFYS